MAEHWNGGTGGKGSKPRPYSVPKEVFDNNFDRIFGKKKTEEHAINEVSKLVAEETLDETESKE
jgi:hypothetical protein